MPEDRSKYDEVWVECEDGQSMCGLINGQMGFLTYLRHNGDAGFTSRNPIYQGPKEAQQEYYLSNGQRDEYPMDWALPLEEVRRALKYFEDNKKPPSWIKWHNDSDDGAEISD